MNKIINDVLEQLAVIFSVTDDVLRDWDGKGNIQFPNLLGMLAVKMNWNEKQMREVDPLIRFYIRHNSDYYVTRGAHGGIMKSSDKQKKEMDKVSKDIIKKQMQKILEDKTATMISASELFSKSVESNEVVVNDEDIDLFDESNL